FRNNLFITTGGARLLEAANTQPGVVFQGNDYWSSGGAFSIKWGATIYASLDAWRAASGLEKIGTTNVGFSVDPQLENAGAGGTLGDASFLEALSAYQLRLWSPMREAGLDLTALFGQNVGPRDFYGNSVPNGLASDIGAHDGALMVALRDPSIESGHFTASYLRGSPLRPDLAYEPQLSGDLSTWCTNCVAAVQTNNLGDGSELVKLREL